MRVESRIHNLLLVMLIAGLVILGGAVSAATAGEVHGKITRGTVRAHAGSMMGGLPSTQETVASATPLGPVLIYIGEATTELPLRETAPIRLRMTAGGLTPPLQAISIGSVIEFENADATAHRLQGMSSHGSFDFGWQAGGTTRSRAVTQVGVISLRCGLENRHLGELVVLPHSCFALTDASGSFRLIDLPPGPATIVAYSSRLGEISRRVDIPASGRAEVGFVF